MRDTNDLVKMIRQAAVEAVRAEKPMEVTHGRVVSTDPLLVEVDQKIQLGEKQLDLGEALQEYEAEVELEVEEMDLELEIDGKVVSSLAKGTGKLRGKMVTRRGLDVGTDVILMRMQGGQKYTLHDKVKKNDA